MRIFKYSKFAKFSRAFATNVNRTFPKSRLLIGGSIGCGIGLYYLNSYFDLQSIGFTRFSRTIYTAGKVWAIYKHLELTTDENSAEYQEALRECHRKCAASILHCMVRNGGIYIKFGQAMSTMNHLVPAEITQVLRTLQDSVIPHHTYTPESIDAMFREDLGADMGVERVFETFNFEPFAAASLAQVHVGWLRDSRQKVAVKVQYPKLKKRYTGDMSTILTVLRVAQHFRPEFPFRKILIKARPKLERELNFLEEADNAIEAQRNLTGSLAHSVHIPKVYREFSSDRILTCEFVNGIKIDDTERLQQEGFSLKRVDEIFINLFAHQVFETGFIHADPHPGNIFVRARDPKSPPSSQNTQLVLIDHGLYQRLSEPVRLSLCRFFLETMFGRVDRMGALAEQIGIPKEHASLFAQMILQRPFVNRSGGGAISLPTRFTQEDAREMMRTMRQNRHTAMQLMNSLPDEIILFFRSNTIQSNILMRHGNLIDRFSIMGHRSINGLYRKNSSEEPRKPETLKSRFAGIFRLKNTFLRFRDAQILEYHLKLNRVKRILAACYLKLLTWLGRNSIDLEELRREMTQDMKQPVSSSS